jgi:4-amino-4-deoxy-L-arabinose transferase-like glycosyltransferase
MGDETALQPAAATATTPDAASDGEIGAAERERLTREVAELRRQVARLGLELQVERERSRRLEEQLGLDGTPEDLDGPHRLAIPPPDRVRERANALLGTVWPRLRQLGAPCVERKPAVAWSRVTGWEAVAFVALVAVAVLTRVWDVADLPPGLQGDEAAGGIVARQIRDQGWIGPYAPFASGVPAGTYYVIAGLMGLVDDEVLAIRLAPAIFGALTVIALYLLVRRNFGVAEGLAAGLFLATMGWHIHFSRIAFPTVGWLLFVVCGLLCLGEAVRGGSWRWWAAAGAFLGLGLYTYHSHVLLLGLVGVAVVFRLFGWTALGAIAAFGLYSQRPGFLTLCLLAAALFAVLASPRMQDGRRLAQVLAFAGAFLVVALPMLRYIADDANDYFGYGRRLSVFNSENVENSEAARDWVAADGPGDKVAFMGRRYLDYWDRVCCDPRTDFVDATGVTAIIPLVTLVLAAIGLALLGWRGRWVGWIGAMLLLAMPLASALSDDFALRRSLVVAVFIALFAGVGVVGAIRWALARGPAARLPVIGLVVFLATLSVYRNLDDYFGTTVNSEPMHWTLAVEMVEASRYVATLPEDSYVYFYSERWPWTHEIRRFFAPDARGEDRSRQFGDYGFAVDPTAGQPVFLFLDNYRGDLAAVQARFPGGQTIAAGDLENPDYVVYLPAPVPAPTPVVPGGSPEATPTEAPRARYS